MQKSFTYPITLNNWKNVPVFSGQLATKDDVNSNKAMFCTMEAEGKLCEMDLPFCAIYTEKKSGKKLSVVGVQAEIAHQEVIISAIKIDGETIVCTLSELDIVNNPDITFFTTKDTKPWWKFW